MRPDAAKTFRRLLCVLRESDGENGGIMRERRWRGYIPDWDVSGWRRHTGGHEGHRSSAFMACPKSTSVKAIWAPRDRLEDVNCKKAVAAVRIAVNGKARKRRNEAIFRQ